MLGWREPQRRATGGRGRQGYRAAPGVCTPKPSPSSIPRRPGSVVPLSQYLRDEEGARMLQARQVCLGLFIQTISENCLI